MLDMQLLHILESDSSLPLVTIAKNLQVTEGTVRNRIRRLRRTGVIKRFTISIDSLASGRNVIAFILLNTMPGRLPEVAKKLSALEVVNEVYEIHTYGDLLLKVRAKSTTELADVLTSKIKGINGVVGTQVITVLNAWKE
jgi:Lrp/AsnC family transcriptional regulator, regulator for asnA, asnC and gidA